MRIPSRRTARRGRRPQESGAAAVEFAIVSMLLITLLFGIVQYGWFFYSAHSASNGAREAARRLSVGDCQAAEAAQSFARKQAGLSALDLDWGPEAAPTAASFAGMDIGDVFVVSATVNSDIVGFVPMPNDGEVVRTVTSRLEDIENSGAAC